jgi:hypothetical protein
MNFSTIDEMKAAGFSGFVKMKDLFTDSSTIPREKGVYMVFLPKMEAPKFLETGSGGFFKGKNPNIPVGVLKSNWVNDTLVVYIGKAGKEGGGATLQSRLRQYLRFGQSHAVGHWGGRLIWQLQNAPELIVCWKALPEADPREAEATLIDGFREIYGNRPFANLAD